MPKVQVIANPIKTVISGNSRVTGITLSLNLKGKGNSLASATSQPCRLEFFEADGQDDVQDTHSLLASLDGEISLDGSTPKFNGNNNTIQYRRPGIRGARVKKDGAFPIPAESTDWFLDLRFDDKTFSNVDPVSGENKRLFLPWFPLDGEGGVLEVGVALLIGSQLEFLFNADNVAAVAVNHQNVPRDGVSGQPRFDHFGCGMVHPDVNHIFKKFSSAAGKVKCPVRGGVHRIRLNFHNGVGSVIKDFDRVMKHVVKQFEEPQLFIDATVGLSDSEASTAGFSRRNDPNFPGDKTIMATSNAGAEMPFFDYWVFFETGVRSQPSAMGLGEELVAVQAKGDQSTKNVLYPVRLLSGNDGRAGTSLLEGDEQRDVHIANLISHEVGHSLGLEHCIQAVPSNKAYQLTPTSPDVARAVMSHENLGAFTTTTVRRFGPIHSARIAKDYF